MFQRTGPRIPRVYFLDEVRGLCIIFMVIYHGAYDIIYLFGRDIPAFHWPIIQTAQPVVAGTFILISGMACRFSRNNLKRGCIALAIGLAMGIFTILIMPDQAIYFGILHLLGTCMLLYGLLGELLDVATPIPGMLVCLLLFVATFRVRMGWLGIGALGVSLPAEWAANRWLLPLGFSGGGADYFPLLPWMFLFFAGSYLGVPFARREMPEFFYRSHVPLLGTAGRYTIFVYVLHQPVLYGMLTLIFWMIGKFGG